MDERREQVKVEITVTPWHDFGAEDVMTMRVYHGGKEHVFQIILSHDYMVSVFDRVFEAAKLAIKKLIEEGEKKMRVMGLDLSLCNTGVVILESEDWRILQAVTIKSKPQENETQRIVTLGGTILQGTQKFLPGLTVIEGPAFGMKNTNCIWQLGELAGVVKQYLYLYEFKFVIIPPTQLKKFITGKGNAKKDQMMLAVYKKYGVEFADDHQCDAYALARMGVEQCR